MTTIREDELAKVNGGMGADPTDPGDVSMSASKIKTGDRVSVKASPNLGVGTVTSLRYDQTWVANVVFDSGTGNGLFETDELVKA